MSALYRVYDTDTTTSLSFDAFITDKTAMDAPMAPRPPLARPILGLNSGGKLNVGILGIALVLGVFCLEGF